MFSLETISYKEIQKETTKFRYRTSVNKHDIPTETISE